MTHYPPPYGQPAAPTETRQRNWPNIVLVIFILLLYGSITAQAVTSRSLLSSAARDVPASPLYGYSAVRDAPEGCPGGTPPCPPITERLADVVGPDADPVPVIEASATLGTGGGAQRTLAYLLGDRIPDGPGPGEFLLDDLTARKLGLSTGSEVDLRVTADTGTEAGVRLRLIGTFRPAVDERAEEAGDPDATRQVIISATDIPALDGTPPTGWWTAQTIPGGFGALSVVGLEGTRQLQDSCDFAPEYARGPGFASWCEAGAPAPSGGLEGLDAPYNRWVIQSTLAFIAAILWGLTVRRKIALVLVLMPFSAMGGIVLGWLAAYPISRVLAPVIWPEGGFVFDHMGPLGFFALLGAAGGTGCAALVGLLIAAVAESVRAKNQR
ncbi:hypothetical protein M0E78_06635 [Corynebacterium sp. P6145]|uniref:hypothetical protein n=1 Tax=Corynebacterium antarcticum TaxID=2800405 RepID=UPI0020036015|nr:hypothetical protein [Corynebacterium antarcticum]MCK7642584.1 hypothetical protein [Corynebacterium antarcticum]MCX7492068.1 hypothetical protein [Corynebacterium antarcticum]